MNEKYAMQRMEWPIAGGDGRGANEIMSQTQEDARTIHNDNLQGQDLSLKWQKRIFWVLVATLFLGIAQLISG